MTIVYAVPLRNKYEHMLDYTKTMKMIPGLTHERIKQVACGDSFIMYLTEDGKVYSSCIDTLANNREGKLGRVASFSTADQLFSRLAERRWFTQAILIDTVSHEKIVQIGAGKMSYGMLTEDGRVYVGGMNTFGLLGTNTCDNKVVPTLLEFLLDRRIVSIACGLSHFMFLDDEGYVFMSGWGTAALTTILEEDHTNLTSQQIDQKKTAQTIQDQLLARYTNTRKHVFIVRIVPDLVGIKIVKIACGGPATLCLSSEGEVYSFGSTSAAVLGIPDFNMNDRMRPQKIKLSERIVDFSVGGTHSLLLTGMFSKLQSPLTQFSETGTVLSFGAGTSLYYEMCRPKIEQTEGVPTNIHFDKRVTRIFAKSNTSVLITDDDKVYVSGRLASNDKEIVEMFADKKIRTLAIARDALCIVCDEPGHLATDFLASKSTDLADINLLVLYAKGEIQIPAHRSIISRNSVLRELIEQSTEMIGERDVNESIIPTAMIDLSGGPSNLASNDIDNYISYLYSDVIPEDCSRDTMLYIAQFFKDDRLYELLNSKGCTPASSLGVDLSQLVNNQKYSDIALIVHSNDFSDQRTIYAHKNILCARSSYFHALLLGGLEETGKAIIDFREESDSKITESSLLCILHFLYTGKLPDTIPLSTDLMFEVAVTSQMWDITILKTICDDWLGDFVCRNYTSGASSVQPINDILEFAEMNNLTELAATCKVMLILMK